MDNLSFATIVELQELLLGKKVSQEEVLDFFLRAIEIAEPHINATLEIFDKQSIITASSSTGSLAGIPGLIKDNICIKNRIASCGSRMLQDFVSPFDATAIHRLKSQGALLLGRANMDEFAMGSSTETSAYKKSRNPWDTSRVPGGSSGGSAAAVAAGLVPWALGSETGGSVRQPAALCGVVGIKPTYGLISRYGLVAYASSLDQIGILTRSVKDNALVLSAIAGHDLKDSSSLPVEQKNYAHSLDGSLPENLIVGVIDLSANALAIDREIAAAVDNAVSVLGKLGATVKRITLPSFDYSAAAYFILSRAEAASNLARFDGVRYGMRNKKAHTLASMYRSTRYNGFGDEVRTRIIVGNYVLSTGHADEFYANAKKAQQLMRAEVDETFKHTDVIVMPTHATPAFTIGAYDDNKLQIDLQDYFTCPANLTGIPALSLPCGLTNNNLPIGFQIMGPHLSEELLYRIGYAFEQATPWHTLRPPLQT